MRNASASAATSQLGADTTRYDRRPVGWTTVSSARAPSLAGAPDGGAIDRAAQRGDVGSGADEGDPLRTFTDLASDRVERRAARDDEVRAHGAVTVDRACGRGDEHARRDDRDR